MLSFERPLEQLPPPTFAKMAHRISLKLMRRYVVGGGSSKSSEK